MFRVRKGSGCTDLREGQRRVGIPPDGHIPFFAIPLLALLMACMGRGVKSSVVTRCVYREGLRCDGAAPGSGFRV